MAAYITLKMQSAGNGTIHFIHGGICVYILTDKYNANPRLVNKCNLYLLCTLYKIYGNYYFNHAEYYSNIAFCWVQYHFYCTMKNDIAWGEAKIWKISFFLETFGKFRKILENFKKCEEKRGLKMTSLGGFPSSHLLSHGIPPLQKWYCTAAWMIFTSCAVSLIFVDHMTEFDQ